MNINIFEPSGSLDGNKANELRNDVKDALSKGAKTILIDLKDVSFMNSSGIGALVATLKEVKKGGSKLFLCSLSEQVRIIFQLTKMERVFNTFLNREEFEENVSKSADG
ncbi:MAG: STAS domain-containing protein [Symploca sp. SIO2B6]|nr:STAS domain-containing protein [Symploca sp. SIO2B6]